MADKGFLEAKTFSSSRKLQASDTGILLEAWLRDVCRIAYADGISGIR